MKKISLPCMIWTLENEDVLRENNPAGNQIAGSCEMLLRIGVWMPGLIQILLKTDKKNLC